jgi:flagellin
MIINHNASATGAYSNLTKTNENMQKSLEKLSSGLKINRAGDDAAGLAISEKMTGQIRGINMATKNAQDTISLIQTAEGALNETHSSLQRMRELAVQSANDTNTTSDRIELQKEMNQLKQEIDRIGDTTEFNTRVLLSGNFSTAGLRFHIGANEGQSVSITFGSMRASALGISGASVSQAISITSAGAAESAISKIDEAIETVSGERSKYGAMQNRLEHTTNNLRTAGENLQAAESRIRDADMAKEVINFSKNQILIQSGVAMLSQANSSPSSVLSLLQ